METAGNFDIDDLTLFPFAPEDSGQIFELEPEPELTE